MNELELLTPNKIIKTKRKSISLIIKTNGEFIVRCPKNATDKRIFDFIHQKANWIIMKRKLQLTNTIKTLTLNNSNEYISILGNEFRIELVKTSKVTMRENTILIPEVNSKEKLIKFLKQIAKQHFQERIQEFALKFNFSYEKVSVSSAKTCWGSCSGRNNINLTYKLIMCTSKVVDYIIIHELCHTRVKNHGVEFWSLVEKCCPNYKQYEKWLKDNRRLVELI